VLTHYSALGLQVQGMRRKDDGEDCSVHTKDAMGGVEYMLVQYEVPVYSLRNCSRQTMSLIELGQPLRTSGDR
jgi:hypothetical protein